MLLLAASCGGEALRDDVPVAPDPALPVQTPPVAPAALNPVMMTPCPAGWAEDERDGVTTCEPWPDGRKRCPPDEAQFPGTVACARIGTSCPADGWPEGVGANAVFVRASTVAAGSGTRADPFGSIGLALAGTTGPVEIALATGVYDEVVELRDAVTIVGACPAETIVHPSTQDTPAAIRVRGNDVVLRNFRISGERVGVDIDDAAAGMLADAMIFDGTRGGAFQLRNVSQATLRNSSIRNTRPAPDGRFGRGLQALGSSVLAVEHVVIAGGTEIAVVAANGASIDMVDVAIVDTATTPGVRANGRALHVQRGERVTLRRGVIDNVARQGAAVLDAESLVRLEQVVIRNVLANPGVFDGGGVSANEGGRVELDRVLIERIPRLALSMGDSHTKLTANDIVLRDGLGDDEGRYGRGATLSFHCDATIQRAVVSNVREVGLLVSLDGVAKIEDLLVEDIIGEMDRARIGDALALGDRGQAELTRVLFRRSQGAAITAFDSGTQLIMRDFIVQDTEEIACARTTCREKDPGGVSITAVQGAHIQLERGIVTRGALCGLQVAQGGTMDARDVTVSFHPIGANIQTEGFDYQRIARDVRYTDNGQNLDAHQILVPSAPSPLP